MENFATKTEKWQTFKYSEQNIIAGSVSVNIVMV
jgi:hypothetical protein